MAIANAHAEKRRNFKDAGRVCPADYYLDPQIFSQDPAHHTNVLYVVGGLYGNPFALDAVEQMAASENEKPLIVLNGDVHWFDKTAENFLDIERRVASYVPLVGNVEAELRRQDDIGVGCGCSYPSCTSDASVSRSNRMHKMLSVAVAQRPECKALLQGRPPAMTVDVAGVKVGITHGDEKLIGGWDCSREALEDPLRQDELGRWMKQNSIGVFATTHTCAAVGIALEEGLVINNGAAGLPNFEGQHFGLMTRIATTPAPEAVFGTQRGGVYVEAVPVRYDHDAYLEWFDRLWSRNSAGAVSYRPRIVDGPPDRIDDALLGGFRAGAPFCSAASQVRHRATQKDLDDALSQFMYFEDMITPDQAQTVEEPKTMQVNIGLLCNLSCAHCHMESGPHRKELMSRETMQAVLDVMDAHGMETLDITGGAPEMNPDFEWLIEQGSRRGLRVVVRSNLVALRLPAYAHLIEKYAQLGVEVVASLPALNAFQSEEQRGGGTFDASIDVLKELCSLGYGQGSLKLNLVYNPQTPFLSPRQEDLESMYKRRLLERYGITFDRLFAIANCPIGRFGVHLLKVGDFEGYMDLLLDNFNPDAAEGMMCRTQLSVGFDGRVYDCDFNQAVGLPAKNGTADQVLSNPDAVDDLTIFDYQNDPARSLKRSIRFGAHCYSCTAGQGSSCEGTLVQGDDIPQAVPRVVSAIY